MTEGDSDWAGVNGPVRQAVTGLGGGGGGLQEGRDGVGVALGVKEAVGQVEALKEGGTEGVLPGREAL